MHCDQHQKVLTQPEETAASWVILVRNELELQMSSDNTNNIANCIGTNEMAVDDPGLMSSKYVPQDQSDLCTLTMENTKREMLDQLEVVVAENTSLRRRVGYLEAEVTHYREKLYLLQGEGADHLDKKDVDDDGISQKIVKEEVSDQLLKIGIDKLHRETEGDNSNKGAEEPLEGTGDHPSCSSIGESENYASTMKDENLKMKQYMTVTEAISQTCVNELDKQYGIVDETKTATNCMVKYDDDPLQQISSAQRYVCKICKRIYQTKSSLRKHMIVHSGRKHSCGKCSKTFATVETLERHDIRMHKGIKPSTESCEICGRDVQNMPQHKLIHSDHKDYICFICGKTFKTNAHCERHMKRHRKTPHSCKICDKNYESERELNSHIRVHKGNRMFYCSVCCDGFKSSGQLMNHKEVHVGEKPLKCKTCGKHFKEQIELDNHVSIHFGGATHCPVCDKEFVSVSAKNKHMMLHAGEKPHQCKVCNKRYLTKRNLRRHLVKHSELPQCESCGHSFTSTEGLKRHIARMHEGLKGKEHCCEICGKYYEQIQQHMLTHSDDRVHKCSVCGQGFVRHSYLKRHQFTHTGEKPHACASCNKSFARSSSLKQHMMTHSVEKPHTCTLCELKFSNSNGLKQHQLTHTGERPYSCEICGRRFRQNIVLKHHMLTHSGERPHACPVCGKTFSRSHHVKTHIKLVHKCQADSLTC